MNFKYLFISLISLPSLLLAQESVKNIEMNSGMVRSVYLNNIDVTSATNQKLKNVNVTIDSQGNIYIEGTQYQVTLENSYTPLQKAPIKESMPKEMKSSRTIEPVEKKSKSKKPVSPFNEKGEPTAPAQDVAKP